MSRLMTLPVDVAESGTAKAGLGAFLGCRPCWMCPVKKMKMRGRRPCQSDSTGYETINSGDGSERCYLNLHCPALEYEAAHCAKERNE